MLDFDISKMAIIGVVALIVLGPERLPKVARTLGALLGRAQRYMSDVKAEVSREIQLDELRNMRDSIHKAAQGVKTSIQDEVDKTQVMVGKALGQGNVAGTTEALVEGTVHVGTEVSPGKRNRWRRNLCAHQSATPLWYRQAHRKRTRVLSGAARVARYRTRASL